MELIVNADDFGKNKSVTDAVCRCFEKDLLTTTTLMVNMPDADRAVGLARENGFADRVGVHLNLTEGRPLTEKIRRRPAFCGEDGLFHGDFHRNILSRLYMGREDRKAVAVELEAQIVRYLDYGLPLKHVDSHHHVHTDLPVFQALKPLLLRYGMASVRISRNLYGEASLFNRAYKRYYNGRLKRLPVRTTDYFGGFEDFRRFGGKAPADARVEVMLHPMYGDGGQLMDTGIPMEEVEKLLHDKG